MDVEDILAATEYLSLLNIFDGRRVCLRTTAGGRHDFRRWHEISPCLHCLVTIVGSFPALQVFTTHPDYYIGAVAHFMVADLAAAARDNTDKVFHIPAHWPVSSESQIHACLSISLQDTISPVSWVVRLRRSPKFIGSGTLYYMRIELRDPFWWVSQVLYQIIIYTRALGHPLSDRGNV